MTVADPKDRFAFGKNWQSFLDKHFDEGRLEVAKRHLMDFLGRDTLKGRTFLDIGSGSGIHSLAAWRAGAERVVSFDYDPNSVAATRRMHALAGAPERWTVLQGSVLDADFIATLPKSDIVYSWGVLHHTGAQWVALRHALSRVADDGELYIALYTADAYLKPTPDEWLDLKQAYNRKGPLGKMAMEWAYLWDAIAGRQISGLGKILDLARSYRESRGMSMMVDVRDWLGGWPMEFSTLREVMDVCCGEGGLSLRRLSSGEANNEYLFAHQRADGDLTPAVHEIRSLSELTADRPYWIYGAGQGGELLLERLRTQVPDLKIAGFIDAFKDQPYHDLPVKRLDTTDDLPRDIPLLVTLPRFGAVAHDLVARGFTQVINAYPIVAERRRALGV